MRYIFQERWGHAAGGVIALSTAAVAAVGAATLRPESIEAWRTYVTSAEQRIERELSTKGRFLSTDFLPDREDRRRRLLAGQILVDEITATGAKGEALDVPYALVHHWRGAVFIPGATLAPMLAELREGAPDAAPDDVVAFRLLERRPDVTRVYLRVRRTKFVTVVLDTEHLVRFAEAGPLRASSRSTATRIAEVEDPGTKTERTLTPGEDHGFLWRWNSYWRYEQVPGGVVAECESISLSRGIPAVFRVFVSDLVRSTAEESMMRTLETFRAHFQATERPHASSPAR